MLHVTQGTLKPQQLFGSQCRHDIWSSENWQWWSNKYVDYNDSWLCFDKKHVCTEQNASCDMHLHKPMATKSLKAEWDRRHLPQGLWVTALARGPNRNRRFVESHLDTKETTEQDMTSHHTAIKPASNATHFHVSGWQTPRRPLMLAGAQLVQRPQPAGLGWFIELLGSSNYCSGAGLGVAEDLTMNRVPRDTLGNHQLRPFEERILSAHVWQTAHVVNHIFKSKR